MSKAENYYKFDVEIVLKEESIDKVKKIVGLVSELYDNEVSVEDVVVFMATLGIGQRLSSQLEELETRSIKANN